MKPFAKPFRAELDAYYARLYGLIRDELRYILDPKEVHGEDFPGETFRVVRISLAKLSAWWRRRKSACMGSTGRGVSCWRRGMGKVNEDEGGMMKDEFVANGGSYGLE
jgi:hypothetical protein